MAGLFDIHSITVGPEKCTAVLGVTPGAPLMTSADLEATASVYYLAPGIAAQSCLGDTGSTFQDCMGHTELPHLLEHLTIEIMSKTGLAGKVVCGRTRALSPERGAELMGPDYAGRVFETDLSCPDDVLTVGALSSAVFIMEWAFLYRDQPAPDFPGTVGALAQLVEKLTGSARKRAPQVDEPAAAQGEQE